MEKENREPHPNETKTLLVFNCHEAWVYQLGCLGYPLDIIVGLSGRPKRCWDSNIRPVPPNCRLITLTEALRSPTRYSCIITHNLSDVLDIRHRTEPRLNVIHLPIEARILEESCQVPPQEIARTLRRYMELIGGHVVAVTRLKGSSWGCTEDIVHCGVDSSVYPPFQGHIPCGLRISNYVKRRRRFLHWDFHEKVLEGLPVRLVGYNPDLAGAAGPSESWDHLKSLLQSHRFYVHTADPALEDGFNMATLEAMVAGMPVLGNLNPSSPIEHGVSGFLSDDPFELRKYAIRFLQDRELAVRMGQQARRIAMERFGLDRFRERFTRSIETARLKWLLRKQNQTGLRQVPPSRRIVETNGVKPSKADFALSSGSNLETNWR
ncbi:MAG: glycosyltransferase [Sedimentisphaerales bacterium]|nr:glycosyltransferase [Sedimentisphaerales bacterium]